MKKNNIIIGIISLFLGFTFTGCDDFLHVTSDSQKQASESFRTIGELRSATGYLYANPWFMFNGSSHQVIDARANNIDADGTNSTYLTYAMFAETSGTAGLENVWNSLYNVITQSDYVVNDYAPIARGYVDEKSVNACEGEARFMRGTAYWYLAMIWHDVPIIDDPSDYVLTPTTHPNRFEDVIQYAINDLTYATECLPEIDEKGRVTKYSAEGMLARLCLTAANYAVGDHFSSDYLTRNNVSSNPELALKYFAKAKELTDNVVAKGTQYGLMENYEDLFKVQNNNNKETLFGIQFVPGVETYGLGNSRQDNLAVSSDLTGGLNAWGGSIYSSYDLVHLYQLDGAKSRMRGNVFVAGENYSYLGTHTTAGSWTVTKEKCNIKKFVVGSNKDTDGIAINGNSGLVTPVIRMAEVYLMYTEACMGSAEETTDQLALERFNKVRKRAFYLNQEDYVASARVTRNDLFKERRMEFSLELLFWPDIKRRSFYEMDWVLKYLNNQIKEEDPETELTNYIWYAYTFNPSKYPASSGWNNSPRSAGVVPQTAVHQLTSGSYVHSKDSKANVWCLPYPQTEADKNPLLNREPVNYNFKND